MEKERIHKYIAKYSKYSRRKVETMIKTSQITINGNLASLGDHVNDNDQIKINNKILIPRVKLVYYLLNKPRGYISSTSDEKDRKIITSLVPSKTKVFPVGRLDYNTTGAIILTNDGALTQMLTHPKFKIMKKYIVIIKGQISFSEIKILQGGVKLKTGYITQPAKVKLLNYNPQTKRSKLQLIIKEGKKHQVKLMFLTLGYFVQKLHREFFGPFSVKNIASGKYVKIKPEDIDFIKQKNKLT